MKCKKGQNKFENITKSIIFFMIAGFIAGGLVLGLEEFNKQDIITNSVSVNEENVTQSNSILSPAFTGFPYQLSGVSRITNLSAVNGDQVELSSPLFNVTVGEGGFIKLAPNLTDSLYNVSYSYKSNTVAANITRNSTIGILNVTTLFTVVGILIGVGLLLLVVTKFGKEKE